MSESMGSPWIRDYLIDVAETYGAQLYNAPHSTAKKRAQLTDFLTYQENSYIWAWISDKDFRVSARITKDAVDEYKRKYGRNLTDCRFSLVFVNSYRPMFSPRPLGPNMPGNTQLSHISLDIDRISMVGSGGHLFGNPRDPESDDKLKEWVLGLRQDGGGGNVLKLRKQQELAQSKGALPSPPSPPSFSLYAPPQVQATKVIEDATESKSEGPPDFMRAYTKRWRRIELDRWTWAAKPAVEEQPHDSNHSRVDSHLDKPDEGHPLVSPSSSHRTPSPAPPQRQGTPTDWSPSNRGSSVVPDEANAITLNGTQRNDGLGDVLHPPSDIGRNGVVEEIPDNHSLRPPSTPTQRVKRSPLPHSSPTCSSPEVFIHSSIPRSQQLPHSSPPPPSSLLQTSPTSALIPMGIRRNILRKVPHPGLPFPRPDTTKQGPTQILVPNSDTSGTGSSQSHLQSQQSQSQSLFHPPSSLAKEFQPADASTPVKGRPSSSTGHADEVPLKLSPMHDDSKGTDVDIGKLQESMPTQQPTPNAPKIEVLEVETSDTEEEVDELESTHSTVRQKTGLESTVQNSRERDANADEPAQLSADDADIHLSLRSIPDSIATSVKRYSSPTERETDDVPTNLSPPPPEPPAPQSSMCSLFSVSLEDERTATSPDPALPINRNEDERQEQVTSAHSPKHDPEAWKQPSFIIKQEGKARAVESPNTQSTKAGKRRQVSAHFGSPVLHRDASSRRSAEESGIGKTCSTNQPPTSSGDTVEVPRPTFTLQSATPRLANFVVNFEHINVGRKVPMPVLDFDKHIKATLLRTGRIRTLGPMAEKDGMVYIHR